MITNDGAGYDEKYCDRSGGGVARGRKFGGMACGTP